MFKKANFIEASDFNNFVKKVTNHNYSFVYQNDLVSSKYQDDLESFMKIEVSCRTNVSYDLFVSGKAEKISDYYCSDEMNLKLQDISVQDLLDGLCESGHIESGLYIISF